jgi:hypothetical protein
MNLTEICEAAPNGDQATHERAKHDGIENSDCIRVRDITDEEPPPGRRRRCMMSNQYHRHRRNTCQEGEGHPEKPVHTAKGHRLPQAHMDQDEGRDDEKTRLAESECQPEPSCRADSKSGGARAWARRSIDPLTERLPDKEGHRNDVAECQPHITLVSWGKVMGTWAKHQLFDEKGQRLIGGCKSTKESRTHPYRIDPSAEIAARQDGENDTENNECRATQGEEGERDGGHERNHFGT